eukprot:2448080-Rhodomonas_salina.1
MCIRDSSLPLLPCLVVSVSSLVISCSLALRSFALLFLCFPRSLLAPFPLLSLPPPLLHLVPISLPSRSLLPRLLPCARAGRPVVTALRVLHSRCETPLHFHLFRCNIRLQLFPQLPQHKQKYRVRFKMAPTLHTQTRPELLPSPRSPPGLCPCEPNGRESFFCYSKSHKPTKAGLRRSCRDLLVEFIEPAQALLVQPAWLPAIKLGEVDVKQLELPLYCVLLQSKRLQRLPLAVHVLVHRCYSPPRLHRKFVACGSVGKRTQLKSTGSSRKLHVLREQQKNTGISRYAVGERGRTLCFVAPCALRAANADGCADFHGTVNHDLHECQLC